MNNAAVVTGGGSGVGRAVAIDLVRRGYCVAVLGRRKDPLEETIALAKAAHGNTLAIACDVSDPKQVRAMGEEVYRELGMASVLVNSAGTNIARRALTDLSIEDYQLVVNVDLDGAFYCVHEFLPGMRKMNAGTIVNVVSDAGVWANRVSGAAYIAAKFGLRGLTAAINAEERRNGIRACAVCPGEINTPLLDRRPVVPGAEARAKMLQAEDVSACVMLAIDLPSRATVEEIIVRPRES